MALDPHVSDLIDAGYYDDVEDYCNHEGCNYDDVYDYEDED